MQCDNGVGVAGVLILSGLTLTLTWSCGRMQPDQTHKESPPPHPSCQDTPFLVGFLNIYHPDKEYLLLHNNVEPRYHSLQPYVVPHCFIIYHPDKDGLPFTDKI